MRTRQQRALQLYTNALDLGCGFRHEGDAVIVLAPTPNGKGQPHSVLQATLDRYQDILTQLVPRHGVAPDRLRPAPKAGQADDAGDKMGVIRRGVESAKRTAAKPKRYGHKPPVRKPARKPVGFYHEIIEP